MKQKMIQHIISILVILAVASQGFSKENANDDEARKNHTKIIKEETTKRTVQSSKDSKPVTETEIDTKTNNIITTVPTNIIPSKSQSMTGEQIKWQVISSGGVTGSSSNNMMYGTIGQIAVGLSTSTNYQINSGFWQIFSTGGSGCCIGIRGNVEGDIAELIDISDLVYLVDFMFTAGPPPLCTEEGNVDGDIAEIIDISDLVYLVDFMFTAGPPPPSC